MPRRFKVGDRVEGKHAAIRNFAGSILEVVQLAGANQLRVLWDNGLQGSYYSRALAFLVLPVPLAANNFLAQGAFAVVIALNPQGNH